MALTQNAREKTFSESLTTTLDVSYLLKSQENRNKMKVSKVQCNRATAMNGCSPHTQLRLTSFFDWIDDPQYKARAVKGLKTWKMTNAHRLTVADKVNIDYALSCYQ